MARAASTRDRILDAGLATIHARGFSASGVQDITQAAGVPKGSFYNHFPSKQALALAALERYWEQAEPGLAPLGDAALPAPARIERHFRLVEAMTRRNVANGCLLGNLAIEAGEAGSEIAARARAMFEQWTSAVASCLADGMRLGLIRRDIAPEDLATLLVAAWEGAVLRARIDPDGRAFDAFFRSLDRLLAP